MFSLSAFLSRCQKFLADPPVPSPTACGGLLSPYEAALISAINTARLAAGVNRLETDSNLMDVAGDWATQLVDAGDVLGCTGLVDRIWWSFVSQALIPTAGPRDDVTKAYFLLSAAVYECLSKPACREILLGSFDLIGVSVREASNGRTYCVVDFDFE